MQKAHHRSSTVPELPRAIKAGLPGMVIGEWYGIVMAARGEKIIRSAGLKAE